MSAIKVWGNVENGFYIKYMDNNKCGDIDSSSRNICNYINSNNCATKVYSTVATTKITTSSTNNATNTTNNNNRSSTSATNYQIKKGIFVDVDFFSKITTTFSKCMDIETYYSSRNLPGGCQTVGE